jgi:hypothetical protein
LGVQNTAIIAVAGAGKTKRVAEAVLNEPDASRTIVLTYTTTNQLEDSLRIASNAPAPYGLPKVTGWRSFHLRGNDLCVLEALLKSSIDIHIVLDPRQSTLSTAARDKKYKEKYQAAKIDNLFRLWEKAGHLTIETMNETRRFTPQIAHFSDLIFEDDLNLGETVSNVPLRGCHDGLFLISKNEVAEYSNKYHATALAVRKSQEIDAYESVNFGLSKGMSRDDVVIVATSPIEELLVKGTRLLPSSACGLYVAVTRARYSVAIAVEQPDEIARAMRSPNSIWKLPSRSRSNSFNVNSANVRGHLFESITISRNPASHS